MNIKENMKKITFIFIFMLIFIGLKYTRSIALSIPEPFIFSVVYISNSSSGQAGTGFLVYRKVNEKEGRVFLISNKHILNPKSLKDEPNEDKEARAAVILNRLENGEIKALNIEVILRDKEGQEFLRRHPNKDIDVAALDFTPYISEKGTLKSELKIGFISEDKLATKDKLEEDFVTVGDKVLILGYPLNLVEGGHCIPIARDGVIASYPTSNFRNLPIILVDATMVRGSSGSPVFLPILPYKVTSKTNIKIGEITQAKLLGIISKGIIDWSFEIKKTKDIGMEPETISVTDVANLGILFKAETIIDIINEFGYPAWQLPIQENVKKEKVN